MPNFGIGTTSGGIVAFDSVAGLSPKMFDPLPVNFTPYTKIEGMSGAGSPIEMGPPTLDWFWWRLTQAQFNYLCGFTSGPWATVYVKQRIEEGPTLTFKTFQAKMWRPFSPDVLPGRFRNTVKVHFTDLFQLD